MIRPLILALAMLAPISWLSQARGQAIDFRVEAGEHDRDRTPIRLEVPEDRLGPGVRQALDAGPVAVGVGRRVGTRVTQSVAQVDRVGEGKPVRVTFVLPTPIGKGEEARFRLLAARPLEAGDLTEPPLRWSRTGEGGGGLDLNFGDRPVFRYNSAPVLSPNYKEIQDRDGYIHPAYSPSGKLITGDFSPFHPHHRGFFLAYARTRSGDLSPDFWNIHHGSGKIYADGLDKPVAGPVTARFSARHRWEAKGKTTGTSRLVLRERWDVEAIEIPRSPYYLLDLTSTQEAVDRPLELLPYRYGGMAYRGPEPFVKGTLDVLNSEGQHRRDGDQKPARWVDLTGPVAEGSDDYAGAMIADHPENPHYPTVVRIHPTSLPFFCYVPVHDKPLTIATDHPTVFRYRIMIHDGRPDPALDERIARDFAEPPVVVVESIGG